MNSFEPMTRTSIRCACSGSLCRLVLLAGLFVAWFGHPAYSLAEPFTPAEDEQVLERLPRIRSTGSSELRYLQEKLRRQPHNVQLATELARQYIELGRKQADPRYDGYAQAALQSWWTQQHAPTELLVLRATLLQRRHDFTAALTDLQRVLSRDHYHAQALLTRASLYEVQGNYAAAMEDCKRLVHALSYPIAATCRASVSARTGQAPQAFEVMKRLTSNSNSTWMQTVLADIAVQLGRADADVYVRRALGRSPTDPYLLALYADLLLQEQRFDEVRSLLTEHTRIDALLLRLALAESKMASDRSRESDLAALVNELARRFEAGRRRGDSIHLREEAIFHLHLRHDARTALDLARQNWAKQREPADAIVLMEAALAAAEYKSLTTAARESAQSLLIWLEQKGLEHARLEPLVQKARTTLVSAGDTVHRD